MRKKLFILLDAKNWIEERTRTPLGHEAGRLLRMLIARLSITREDWVHDYCYLDDKQKLEKKKALRLQQLAGDRLRLEKQVRLSQPCVVISLGKLACEMTTGASLLSAKVCTCWPTDKFGKVWVTYSPDQALYNPGLVVDITAVLRAAATVAGIETKPNRTVPMFDWEPFEKKSLRNKNQ